MQKLRSQTCLLCVPPDPLWKVPPPMVSVIHLSGDPVTTVMGAKGKILSL